MSQSLINILGTPLVNDEIVRIAMTEIKVGRGWVRSHDSAELFAAQALLTTTGDKDRTVFLEDIPGGNKAF